MFARMLVNVYWVLPSVFEITYALLTAECLFLVLLQRSCSLTPSLSLYISPFASVLLFLLIVFVYTRLSVGAVFFIICFAHTIHSKYTHTRAHTHTPILALADDHISVCICLMGLVYLCSLRCSQSYDF